MICPVPRSSSKRFFHTRAELAAVSCTFTPFESVSSDDASPVSTFAPSNNVELPQMLEPSRVKCPLAVTTPIAVGDPANVTDENRTSVESSFTGS